MNDLIAKLVIGGGALSILYGLYLKYQNALREASELRTAAQIKDDLAKIAESAKHVTETERDYNKTVDEFRKNNE